ncbi:MAG: right-handed parallel beta-helix repeat-containing protein [Candidatus Eisenbacteria sp.]|nr:right-handed parallel beta-helix repeat-containing protein [Candidatus Eisenbacteria bacterium]
MRLFAAILAACVSFLPIFAYATTWHVPSQCPTIQAGIDSAAAGDTVLVACGTYYDCTHVDAGGVLNCVIMKSGICLQSETGQADCVTVDADSMGRVVYCREADNATHIDGFTITGGLTEGRAGGMYCYRCSLTVSNCDFVANHGDVGGGMYIRLSSPTVTNCTFSGNSATGSSILGGGGVLCWDSSPVFVGVTLSNNVAGNCGGGMSCFRCSGTIVNNSTFVGNSADERGGGLYSWDCRQDTLVSVTFLENSAAFTGGGMETYGDSSLVLEECTFSMNSVGASGGGLACDQSALTLDTVRFIENSADLYGGGMICVQSSPELRWVTFDRNTAVTYDAGALDCVEESSPVLSNVTFSRNTAGRAGGGLSCYDSSHPEISNATFFGNSAFQGSGVISWYNSSPTLFNSIITFGERGAAVYCDNGGTATLTCCDVFGNQGGDWVGCIADQGDVAGNICEDPRFCSPDSSDFMLRSDSPCRPFSPPNDECDLVGVFPVGCPGVEGTLCFDPDVPDTVYTCLTGDTVKVDVILGDNLSPVGEIGFDMTYESSYFRFAGCSNGDLTASWPPVGCATSRGEDTISVYGYRGGSSPIPAGASGSLVRMTFLMDCQGLIYGDSIPSLRCITNVAYDCSAFVACECRGWTLTGTADVSLDAPTRLSLGENFPNPFNPGTTIGYDLPAPGGPVTLAIYDVRGRLVRTLVDQHVAPGRHEAYWDGKGDDGKIVPSGIYFYHLSTPQGVRHRKAVMLK